MKQLRNNWKSEEGYVIVFVDTKSNTKVFLSDVEDIDEFCYQKDVKLLGTLDISKAKLYDNVEEAKNDVYKLRYYHRQFLKIPIQICHISNNKILKNFKRIKGE